MSLNHYKIVLLYSGRRIKAVEGQTVFQALAQAGILLRSECGGKGVCGKCLVRIRKEPGTGDRNTVGKNPSGPPTGLSESLACQWEVQGNLGVEVPVDSLVAAEVIAKPVFMARFRDTGIGPSTVMNRAGYGLAVDLGTTTIGQFVCDPGQSSVLGSGLVRNPQLIFGDDVMSRIGAVNSNPANLATMKELVVTAVNRSLSALAAACGIDTREIKKVVVVGNSCMIHLFLGMDPVPMGTYPYRPAFTRAMTLAAADVGLVNLRPEAEVHTLPLISGFLGCDIVAAAMASDLDRRDNALLLDVGTNGEIMLNVGGQLSAASCATGPALEGAAISHGIQAVSGAVDAVGLDPVDGYVRYSMIQRNPDEPRKAMGICGSGIVSAVAELLRAGIILESGRFNPESRHAHLRRSADGAVEFVVVPAEDTDAGADITLTQQDVRAVQLAKGALFAAITLLCREAGLAFPQRVLMAGAFGTFMNPDDAMTIGMLPRLAAAVEAVGNAAGEGAVLAVLDDESAQRADAIARRTRVVDLASHPDFQKVFLKSLAFPDPHSRSGGRGST